MMRYVWVSALITFCLVARARGHGVQIQITHDSATGRIQTGEIVSTDTRPNTITDPKRVYVMPLMPLIGGAGDGWYSRPDDTRNAFGVPLNPTGPGLTYQYDSQLAGSGWSFSGSSLLPNLQASNFSYVFRDGLKAWNGTSFADAGSEEIQLFRGSGTSPPSVTATSSDVGPFASLPLATINSMSSNPHHSVGLRLLGDGVNFGLSGPAAGDDSIYLVTLGVTSSAIGVEPSESVYLVLHRNIGLDDVMTAVDALGFPPAMVQKVPEPGTLLLVVACGVAVLRRRT